MVIVGGAAMTMLRAFILFPAEFVALTVKLKVPIAVGVPEITPVVSFKTKSVGNLPLEIVQLTGVVPVAASVWL